MASWTERTALERPAELDTTASQFMVYERRNIRQVEQEDMEGNKSLVWSFQERVLTKAEYAELHSPATQMIMQAVNDILVDLELLGE